MIKMRIIIIVLTPIIIGEIFVQILSFILLFRSRLNNYSKLALLFNVIYFGLLQQLLIHGGKVKLIVPQEVKIILQLNITFTCIEI
jgi:hypothetical protein